MKRVIKWIGRIAVAICFIWLSVYAFDVDYVLREVKQLLESPALFFAMMVSYFFAFFLKAKAWQLYMGNPVGIKPFLDGIFYSLFINHLLPVKAGDIVRTGYLAQWKKVGWQAAIHSVVVMRLLDLIVLGSIAVTGAVILGLSLSFLFAAGVFVVSLAICAGVLFREKWRRFLFTQLQMVFSVLCSVKGSAILFLVFLSWCMEAIILLAVSAQFDPSLSYLQALWVNSFTIAGQVFHFSPGGIGTYESFMSFGLAAVDVPLKDGYTIALITHGFKFLFSFAAGAYLILYVPVSWKTLKKWITKKGR